MNKKSIIFLVLIIFSTINSSLQAQEVEKSYSYSQYALQFLLGGASNAKFLGQKSQEYIKALLHKKGIVDSQNCTFFEIEADMRSVNAAAGKVTFLPKMVLLYPLIADMLEKCVISEEKGSEEYIFNYRYGRSPYSLKIIIQKKQLEKIIQAVLEHEAGHLYHEHYEKFSPGQLLNGFSFIGFLWWFTYRMKESLDIDFSSDIYKNAVTLQNQVYFIQMATVSTLITVLYGSALTKGLFKGEYPESIDKERQADSFVADDEELLVGLKSFFIILDEMLHYIMSYESKIIRFLAWKNGITPQEYYEKNKYFCQRYIFSSSLFNPSHPTFQERITTVDERIVKLQQEKEITVEAIKSTEQCKIEVYKDGKIVNIV